MPGLKDISSVWNNIKEVDLKPIRDSAIYPLRLALVGAEGSGRHALAEQLRTDPKRADIHTQSTIMISIVEMASQTLTADLIILMVDARHEDLAEELGLARKWSEAGKNLLVFINQIGFPDENKAISTAQEWPVARLLAGPANDSAFLVNEFVPVILEMLPHRHLALGRLFPLFRLTIAHQLINETCFSNAAYSFSTGLAEIVPVLDLPLNLTDLVILTKSQAFMAYKLGLLVGFSTRWQDYVTEFGGVIGGGFVWRQAARSLVGLVPGWGIIPKVAIAYSGTYVVGHAILGWYLGGKHLTPKQMRDLSLQAFTRGKEYARTISAKLPKRKPRKKQEGLPAGKIEPAFVPDEWITTAGEIVIDTSSGAQAAEAVEVDGDLLPTAVGEANAEKYLPRKRIKQPKEPKRIRILQRRQKLAPAEHLQVCPQCGRTSSADAQFCQYCGMKLVS
ncbi:MAG: hypothetical protein C3F13_03025 [Anaerolineales bacterium]|nr:MAG: hypothetical protein C3F13_03025 [Anaerolineales bacterium]